MIQPLAPGQVNRALDIDREAGPYPWRKSDWLSSLKNDECYQWLEGEEAKAVAAFSLAFDEVNLLNISVREIDQGRGFARRLLEGCLKQYSERGMRHCFLEVRRSNRAAIGLYRALGFNVIGERSAYYPIKGGREDALVMLLRLTKGESVHART